MIYMGDGIWVPVPNTNGGTSTLRIPYELMDNFITLFIIIGIVALIVGVILGILGLVWCIKELWDITHEN